MSAHAELQDRPALDLPHINAELHYLGRMTERPTNYTYDPPPGVPRSNTVHESHVVPIYDLRPIEAGSRSTAKASSFWAMSAPCATSTTTRRCARFTTPKRNG